MFFRINTPALLAIIICLLFISSVSAESPAVEGDKVADVSASANGSEHEHVHTSQGAGHIRIADEGILPSDLKVHPGQTVVWFNTSGGAVRVKFMSKAVSTTCKGPRGFIIGDRGIFHSELIAQGDAASLCFLEPDAYDYKIELFEKDVEPVESIKEMLGVVNVITK